MDDSLKGLQYFLTASSFLFIHRKLNEVFDELLIGKRRDSEPEPEEEAEEGGDEAGELGNSPSLRRIDSEFSLGLNRVKSVDDMIRNFEWELCSNGQRAIHGVRIAGYALLAAFLIGQVVARPSRPWKP